MLNQTSLFHFNWVVESSSYKINVDIHYFQPHVSMKLDTGNSLATTYPCIPAIDFGTGSLHMIVLCLLITQSSGQNMIEITAHILKIVYISD